MAAPINLTSTTTLEQQAYLCALEMQKLELAIPVETRPDNTTIAFNTENGSVSMNITLNTLTTIEGGKAVIAAQPYLDLTRE